MITSFVELAKSVPSEVTTASLVTAVVAAFKFWDKHTGKKRDTASRSLAHEVAELKTDVKVMDVRLENLDDKIDGMSTELRLIRNSVSK